MLTVYGAATINLLQKIAVEESRLGIPMLIGNDVIHGYRTIFPIPLAESCTWDPDLVEEAARMKDAEILVAAQTDPGWAPLFPLARGLVLERGGMLSHGAIIAREYGIPAVVGVADATRRIGQGQRICVDGDRGEVRIID